MLTASPLFHFHNNLVRRNCYPISLIRKQAKEKLSRALVPTNRLPGSSGGAHATGRLRGNRVRPAPSPPPPTSAPARRGFGEPRRQDDMATSRLPPATLTLKQVPAVLAGLLGQLFWV